jgi:hypothetical protein
MSKFIHVTESDGTEFALSVNNIVSIEPQFEPSNPELIVEGRFIIRVSFYGKTHRLDNVQLAAYFENIDDVMEFIK